MSRQKRKKKRLKKQKALRRKLENPERTPKTQAMPKRRTNKTYRLRRKLKKAAPRLIMLAFVFIIGGILWMIASQNQIALADKPEAVAHEPAAVAETVTQQSDQVVIQRSTYPIAGQNVAMRISGDPNPENNGLFYLYTDHLGSVVSVTDEDGNPVSDITRFYPYGETRSGETSEVTDRGFTGHQHNDDLGLIYMNSRYYVPGIGRFASPDTIVPDPTNPQTLNRYSYVNNNPVNYTDPTGHCIWDICIVEGVLVVGLAVLVYDAVTPNQDIVAGAAQGLTDIVYAVGDALEDGFETASNNADVLKRELAGNTASSPGDFDPNDDDDDTNGNIDNWLDDTKQTGNERVPNSWDQKPTSGRGEGWRWSDPNNPTGNNVRIDRGNPYSSDPIQQVDHVHIRYDGRAIKADGSSVPSGVKASNVPETHIPLDDWLNWTNWFSP